MDRDLQDKIKIMAEISEELQEFLSMSISHDTLSLKLSDRVELRMIRVKAGSFRMESSADEIARCDDEKLHRVTLTKDYWLGEYPVTQLQWAAIMKKNPSRYTGYYRPVERVSWYDAKDFCNKLNQHYANKLPSGYRFDLPTETQWEYACRGDTTTAYFWGDSCNGTDANCDGNYPCGASINGPYLLETSDVGKYKPNSWGVYDMHGNVWEWCRDWYAPYNENVTDPDGPSGGFNRVMRGGSWFSFASCCRSASRNSCWPDLRNSFTGFRLALVQV